MSGLTDRRAPAADRHPRPRPGPRPARPGGPGPDALRLAGVLVLAWREVTQGRRAFGQLSPLVSPALRRRLAAELATGTPPGGTEPARVRAVRASRPREGVIEATVLVEGPRRVTAVAVRVERHLGAWRAVELAAPDGGTAPLLTASLPDGHRRRDAFDEVAAEVTAEPAAEAVAGPAGLTPRGSA